MLPPLVRAVKREGSVGGVVVRSDARQHDHVGERLQDPAVRPILKEVKTFFAVHAAEGTLCRRRPSGDDRPERHRMHRRRARDHRRGPQRPLSHASAIRGSTPSRRSSWRSCWPNCSRRSAPPRRSRCRRRPGSDGRAPATAHDGSASACHAQQLERAGRGHASEKAFQQELVALADRHAAGVRRRRRDLEAGRADRRPGAADDRRAAQHRGREAVRPRDHRARSAIGWVKDMGSAAVGLSLLLAGWSGWSRWRSGSA